MTYPAGSPLPWYAGLTTGFRNDGAEVWCYCYATPEPESWVFPDDKHADECDRATGDGE